MQPLRSYERNSLFLLSLALVAFGQPVFHPGISLIAAFCGYGLFCRILLDISDKKRRFWLGTLWFSIVQAIQLSWMLYHPYSYIYIVHPLFSLFWGLQWGFFSLFLTQKNILSFRKVIALASLWTLLEWSRFFFLSGYSWNPAGIAFSENLYALQLASVGGIFALSFWILLANLLALRAWLYLPQKAPVFLSLAVASFPYLFGMFHLALHSEKFNNEIATNKEPFRGLLVQTAFPAEEALPFPDKQSYIAFVLDEWNQILKIIQPYHGKELDLIALPEYVVPFGTYTFLYPYPNVRNSFVNAFGEQVEALFPPLEEPFARTYSTNQGDVPFVNNAFWAQAISNIFQTELIAGLEDAEDKEAGKREYYSAAIHFKPNAKIESYSPTRYAKRVLLPMAEYIPLSIFHSIAERYGIQGSFTPGEEAVIFEGKKLPFGVSICYEETFGHLMTENRVKGAELLVNLTSDVWYPNSSLPKQHLDHARLRSVENGIPVLRACNTGITTALDSLGRTVAVLGDTSPESQWIADSLYVEVPRYHYPTLYSRFGDTLIILLCVCGLLLFI